MRKGQSGGVRRVKKYKMITGSREKSGCPVVLCRRQAKVPASCLHEEMVLWRPPIIEAAMLRDGSGEMGAEVPALHPN